jgi:hypothetical protein
MMLTNTFKENLVSLAGLTSYEVSFHREDEGCFLVIASDDAVTIITRVKKFDMEFIVSIVGVSSHGKGIPDSGLEILTAIANAIGKETGKYVRVKKA